MKQILFEHVWKEYDGQQVYRGLNAVLDMDASTALTGPSGSGKTVFTRLLMGLEKPDAGWIVRPGGLKFTCVFQEDRLCPGLSAIENVALVIPRKSDRVWTDGFFRVGLLEQDLHKPVRELSGGQRRRVALVRAMEAPGDMVVLDEAFRGLDSATQELAYQYVENRLKGRGMLLVTHDPQEAERLAATEIKITRTLPQPSKGG